MIIKCKECGREISDRAYSCPHCGFPQRHSGNFSKIFPGFEWKSNTFFYGYPLIHIALGVNQKTGRLYVAKGIIAIGQFAFGLITFAQFGVGPFFALGQFVLGFSAIGQIAIALYFAFGQVAIAQVAIGQLAFGKYVLAQVGIGKYLWTKAIKNPVAYKYFYRIIRFFK